MTNHENDPNRDPAVIKPRMQAAFLIELMLKQQQDEVGRLILALKPDEIYPLMGALLTFASSAMQDNFGTQKALVNIEAVRMINGMLADPDFGS